VWEQAWGAPRRCGRAFLFPKILHGPQWHNEPSCEEAGALTSGLPRKVLKHHSNYDAFANPRACPSNLQGEKSLDTQ